MKAQPNLLHSFLTLLALAGFGTCMAANQENIQWHFSNPLPHGNNILDMDYSPTLGLGLQVGDAGQFYHSSDLLNWTSGNSGTTKSLRSVTFLNDRIIITGQEGTVLWGDSVSTIQAGNISLTGNWLESVAASTNLAVAVGDEAAIYTTPDGINWTERSPGFTDWLRGVTWAGGQWVTVGESGRIATSPDGVTWTTRNSGTTSDLNSVAYLDGTYYAVGGGGVTLESVDAVSWTSEALGATNNFFAIGSAGGTTRFYVGENAIWQTLNGTFWTNMVNVNNGPPAWTYYSVLGFVDALVIGGRAGFQVDAFRTNGVGAFTWDVPYETPRQWMWDSMHNGLDYVAVGDFGSVMTSANGVNYTLEVVPNSITNTTLLGVTGDTNLLVAVGDSGKIIYSTNSMVEFLTTNGMDIETNFVSELGIAWAEANSQTSETLQAITMFQGEFYVGGNNGYLAKSANGSQWSAITPFGSRTLTSMAASDGGTTSLVVVGDNGTAYISADGANYLPANINATSDWLYRVRYLNGNFVIVGENGTVMTSADAGNTWTTQNSGTSAWLNDVIWVGDRYYAVGTQGAFIESPDLVNWTSKDIITGKSLYSLAADRGQMVATGVEGLILRSLPAPQEVEIVSHLFQSTNNVYQSAFLFAGQADQQFNFDVTGPLTAVTTWTNLSQFEITDADGFLFHVENLSTNTLPGSRIFRTDLTP